MGRKIIITGGNMTNKGAQAMTFIVADEMAKRYPEHQCVVLNSGRSYPSLEERSRYRFEILPPIQKSLPAFLRCLKEADALIDISGYAFGSNWGAAHVLIHLLPIVLAVRKGIRVYVLPQSFGPFSFSGVLGRVCMRWMDQYLLRADMVCARETEGLSDLKQHFTNAERAELRYDIVLSNKGLDPCSIYKQVPEFYSIEVRGKSAAVIPNSKNEKYGGREKTIACYRGFIDSILKDDKEVYILSHSGQDMELCRSLKEDYYPQEERVHLVEKELSCIEFDREIRKFDYIVASRFHAVVHAYRNSVPVIVLGWSEKYRTLTELFGEEQFQFDIRKEIAASEIEKAVEHMSAGCSGESRRIRERLAAVQERNLFDEIKISASESLKE